MEGYPAVLNTKDDYLNMLEIDREETVRRLKELLHYSMQWQYQHDLEDGDEGITDDFHRVESITETGLIVEDGLIPEGSKVTRMQFKYMHHPSSQLVRLGFTVEEVEQLIAENDK